tara:strand:+ start:1997 stop:2914 length:918 start_codon:yes stop_codon:yes gene_type:complete
MPDKLTDTRFVEVFNAGYAAIPAYGAMQVESAIEFGDAVEKERIVHNVQLPQEDSLTPTRVLFNGPIAIEPGEYGVGTRDYPALAKYDNAHHLAMQAGTPYGTLAGEPHLSFTQSGFVSLGVAKSSFGRPTFRVVPEAETPMETHVGYTTFVRYEPNFLDSTDVSLEVDSETPMFVVDTRYLNKGIYVFMWCEVTFSSSSAYETELKIGLQEKFEYDGNWHSVQFQTINYKYDPTDLPLSPFTARVAFEYFTRGNIDEGNITKAKALLRPYYNATDSSGIDQMRGYVRVMGIRDTVQNRYNPISH